jgi:hypothetical protein
MAVSVQSGLGLTLWTYCKVDTTECPRNKYRKLQGEYYGPKQLKQFI